MIKRNQITYFSRDKIEHNSMSPLNPYSMAVDKEAFESLISVERDITITMSFSGYYSDFFENIIKTNEDDL